MIKAECHTDDYVYEVEFDATAWFEEADGSEIIKLANISWGGDYEADDVVYFFEGQNEEIGILLDYCRKADVGFECHVSEKDALAWLKENRPILHYQIMREPHG